MKFLQAVAEDPRFDLGRAPHRDRRPHEAFMAAAHAVSLPVDSRREARAQEATPRYRLDNKNPDWGPGRVDPFNPVKFGMLKLPVDPTIGNSEPWCRFQYEGAPGYVAPLGRVERVVARSRAQQRAWQRRKPQVDPAGEPRAHRAVVDGGSAARVSVPTSTRRSPARAVPFTDQQCAQCHAAGGKRTGTVVPVEEVGTDRHRLDMWTPAAPVAYNAFAKGYPWAFSGFRKTGGYVTMPLDGVWLRAPYLHNRSVPSLQELFEPVAARRATFYRGYNVLESRPRRLRVGRRGRDAHGHALRHAATWQQQRRPSLRHRAQPGTEEGAHRVSEDAVDSAASVFGWKPRCP